MNNQRIQEFNALALVTKARLEETAHILEALHAATGGSVRQGVANAMRRNQTAQIATGELLRLSAMTDAEYDVMVASEAGK